MKIQGSFTRSHNKHVPCSQSLRLLGYFRGSLGTYGLNTKIVLKTCSRSIGGHCGIFEQTIINDIDLNKKKLNSALYSSPAQDIARSHQLEDTVSRILDDLASNPSLSLEACDLKTLKRERERELEGRWKQTKDQ